jgi:hypothetical protein
MWYVCSLPAPDGSHWRGVLAPCRAESVGGAVVWGCSSGRVVGCAESVVCICMCIYSFHRHACVVAWCGDTGDVGGHAGNRIDQVDVQTLAWAVEKSRTMTTLDLQGERNMSTGGCCGSACGVPQCLPSHAFARLCVCRLRLHAVAAVCGVACACACVVRCLAGGAAVGASLVAQRLLFRRCARSVEWRRGTCARPRRLRHLRRRRALACGGGGEEYNHEGVESTR